jgi:hypothetical protein
VRLEHLLSGEISKTILKKKVIYFFLYYSVLVYLNDINKRKMKPSRKVRLNVSPIAQLVRALH